MECLVGGEMGVDIGKLGVCEKGLGGGDVTFSEQGLGLVDERGKGVGRGGDGWDAADGDDGGQPAWGLVGVL